jgi:hypothetical protein
MSELPKKSINKIIAARRATMGAKTLGCPRAIAAKPMPSR